MKTQSKEAVLFYNGGPSASNQDFVGFEVWRGRPRLLVDQVRQINTSGSVGDFTTPNLKITQK